MPVDWNALINLGANVAGGIAANRAQNSGIQLSQEALDKAKAEAAAAYGQGSTAAGSALGQGFNDSQATRDWTYGTSGNQLGMGYDAANEILPWGYQQGKADRATGLQNSLGSLATGYGNAFNILNPYAQSGVQALNQANNLIFGKGTPGGGGMPTVNAMPATQYAQQIPMPQMPHSQTVSAPASTPVNTSKFTNSLTGNSLAGLGSGTGSYPSSSTLASQSQQNSAIRGAEGALGGIAVGAGISALGLATASIPILAAIPFVGPILAGVGALIGRLWNNHNPDKTWASNAVNEVSKQTWGPNLDGNGGIAGAVKAGQLTPEQANGAFQGLWQGWITAMKNAGVDQSIIDRSVQSQSGYFKPALDGSAWTQAAAQAPQGGAGGGTAGGTGTRAYAEGGMVPGQDAGRDTVPAMLRGGEFVFTPEAVRHWGVDKLMKMNQAGVNNALSNPQHFATGGTVQPYQYSPTPAGEHGGTPVVQDWSQQLDPGGALPAGYSNYVQGFNPITQQWEYNPNTGEKYTPNPAGGVPLNFSTGTPTSTSTATPSALPGGMPAAGDPNYYKYTSIGGADYTMPKAGTPPANTPPPSGTPPPPSGTPPPPPGTGPTRGTGTGSAPPPPTTRTTGNLANDVQDFQVPGNTTQTTGSVPSRYSQTGTVGGIPPAPSSQAAGSARTGGAGQSISTPVGQQTTATPTRGAPTESVWASAPRVQAAATTARQGQLTNALTQAPPTPGAFDPLTFRFKDSADLQSRLPAGWRYDSAQGSNGGVEWVISPDGKRYFADHTTGTLKLDTSYNGGAGGGGGNGAGGAGGGTGGNPYVSPGGPGSVGSNQEQYPSNWNVNNAPLPDVLNMTGANGATYETSPLYQWQLAQGEKNINRALQARGRYNSSYGLNTLADFYRTLGANESQQNYNRTMDMARLGLQASSQQSGQQAAYGGQASALYQAASQGDAAAAQSLATQLGVNANQYSQLLSALTQAYGGNTATAQAALGSALASLAQWNASGQAQNTWNWANPYGGNAILQGANNAGLALGLGGTNYDALLKVFGLGKNDSSSSGGIWV